MSPSRMKAAAVRSPVSSLKKLLTRSRNPHEPVLPSPHAPKAPIERLPAPIIGGVARHLDSWDILHLGLCSRRLRALLSPALYSRVELKTNKQCKTALITLSKNPSICQYVRQLIVRVNPVEWTAADERVDEDLVANLISRVAVKLQRLESFEWDGLEMPRDELWQSLKTNCHYLKRIATTIGDEPLSASSPLWDFEDLRKVSLTVKCQSLDWISDAMPKTEKLPRKFWAMLLERCPRLEELAIACAAPSPRIFDIRHIMSGRWPRLRRITLGDMALISPSRGEEQMRKDKGAFMEFLAAHPTLRGLHLQQAATSLYFPTNLVLPPGALPNLTAFTGPLTLLRTLPNLHRLQSVNLTTLHHSTSSFPPTFAVLRDLENLAALSIWIDLSFGQAGTLASSRASGEGLRKSAAEEILMLRSLASLLQNLKHLDIMCFTRPTFHVRDLSRVLQAMPNLESFTLTKVCKTNEEDLTKNSLKIVAENRHIKHFTIRLTWDSWFSCMRGRIKHQGTYEVLGYNAALSPPVDADSPTKVHTPGEPNTPVAVVVCHEYGQKSITGKDYSRHFIQDVFPRPRETPPSSFGRHRHSLSLKRMRSYTRPAETGCASDSETTHTHSRSSSISSSFLARVWRRSSSMAAGTAPNSSSAVSPTVAAAASPRSSVSSFSPSAASHGGSVTWADREMSSLGRSGSNSSGAGSRGSPPDVSAKPEDDYVLV